MARTLLQIIQTVCDELGNINRPSTIIGSQDVQVQQLLALANREGKELAAREGISGGWPQLRMEHTDTFDTGVANYPFPSDLQYFINTTSWDRAQKWPMRGPISPQEWQVLKSGTIGSLGPRRRFRIMAGEIYFDPTPELGDNGNTFVLEYYSNAWCESTGGSPQSSWAADNDEPRLPDDCFILGIKWRFRRAKGLDYDEEFSAYEDLVSRELGRSGMALVLDLGAESNTIRFLDESNLPDSGFGV